MKPTKILFIRGFNTNCVPERHYAYFDVVYNKKNTFSFFYYSNMEDISSVVVNQGSPTTPPFPYHDTIMRT